MGRQSLIPAVTSVIIISLVVVGAISFTIHNSKLIGPTIILLGLIPWIPLRLSGRTITSTGADIIFGAIDTGILGILALILNYRRICGIVRGKSSRISAKTRH